MKEVLYKIHSNKNIYFIAHLPGIMLVERNNEILAQFTYKRFDMTSCSKAERKAMSFLEKELEESMITRDYLINHPNEIFVFGDNLLGQGHGGAASLRDEDNTYGFVTKRKPSNHSGSFYHPKDYEPVFMEEVWKLRTEIRNNLDKIYLISKLGAGLANRFHIFEEVIELRLKQVLYSESNVRFLW